MRLTKFEHACVVLEKADAKLIIDPGSFTLPLTDVLGVAGIVITHEHADHWSPDQLDRIRKAAPGVPIYGPQGVADAAAGYDVSDVQKMFLKLA